AKARQFVTVRSVWGSSPPSAERRPMTWARSPHSNDREALPSWLDSVEAQVEALQYISASLWAARPARTPPAAVMSMLRASSTAVAQIVPPNTVTEAKATDGAKPPMAPEKL